ncbi:TetR/AcrR family transcriptional regulator [Actinomyces sp. oral taxon 897]|uniref:TetR/AcrR family transcriptional regulator n=1 Tax=Actinomyces sp. oral taxon 897 TaxID=2081702 RepID=UPI000D033588|nr:TetR/AcrR family transcriptional regulator [Actinomyces sp. oral taxon 897]AVM62558.1 TetR family transcriptional regulator [Actinomyces sp. oral taxon 897]
MTDLPDPISRRDRQRQTREAIVFAARAAFAEDGYHGARLDQIARAAGFSKGAVYSNFAGKAELFLAVLDKNIEDSMSRGWNAYDQAPVDISGNDEIAAAIKGFALASLEFIAVAARDEHLSEQVAQRLDQVVGLYAAVVESSRRASADQAADASDAGTGDVEVTKTGAGASGTRPGTEETEATEAGAGEAGAGAGGTRPDGARPGEAGARTRDPAEDVGSGKTEDPLTSEQLGALLAALDQGAAVLSLAGSTALDQSLLQAGILRLLEPGRAAGAEPASDGEGETALHHRVIRERVAQALAVRAAGEEERGGRP